MITFVGGIVVPYGAVARVGGRRWCFQRGSLHGAALWLLRDHDHAQRVGKRLHAEDREAGMFARFRATGEVRPYFSISVNVEESVPHPDHQGVLLVVRAEWLDTSTLDAPAFDDARVLVMS